MRNGEWNKMTMSRMRKMDSFLKESERFDGAGASKLPFFWLLPLLICFDSWYGAEGHEGFYVLRRDESPCW